MVAIHEALVEAVKTPESVCTLSLEQWDELFVVSRATELFGRLAVRIEQAGLLEAVPSPVQRQLRAAIAYAQYERQQAYWDVGLVRRALQNVKTPIVLLKGAAYHLADLDVAAGRKNRDVDILVAAEYLDEAEATLLDSDWEVTLDDRDHVSYFRQWMHELPPLRHRERHTVLDVHHTVMPRTDAIRLNPVDLLDASIPVGPHPQLRVLSPVDMLLHSAAHLFRNGDFHFGLRDLLDIDWMFGEFSKAPGFWDQLVERSQKLDLRVPCYCAMRYTRAFFHREVPSEAAREVDKWRPSRAIVAVFDKLVPVATFPPHHRESDLSRVLAVLALSYYPIPRPSAMMSGLFWRKRLPRNVRQQQPKLR